MSNVYTLTVRDGMDWAEFFVNERERLTDGSGHARYSATWVCYSSFGVFGHYWHATGSPFADFVQRVDTDYLLSKIGKKQTDQETVIASVKRAILQSRRYGCCTREEAREAMWEVKHIADTCEGGPEVLAYQLWESCEISKCEIEWCDITTKTYEPGCVEFAQRMWPKFVEQLKQGVGV